jgi:hypothetical protein
MQFSKIIIYTFINTILATGRDDSISQNDGSLPQISSTPLSYPNDDSSSNSSLNSSYINYLGLLCIPMIMLL